MGLINAIPSCDANHTGTDTTHKCVRDGVHNSAQFRLGDKSGSDSKSRTASFLPTQHYIQLQPAVSAPPSSPRHHRAVSQQSRGGGVAAAAGASPAQMPSGPTSLAFFPFQNYCSPRNLYFLIRGWLLLNDPLVARESGSSAAVFPSTRTRLYYFQKN